MLLFAGCGGGDDMAAGGDFGGGDTSAMPADGGAGAPADGSMSPDPAVSGDAGGGAIDPMTGLPVDPNAATVGNQGDGEVAAPGNQVRTSEATPRDFTKMIGKRTILVVVYQPKATLDGLVLDEAKAAASGAKQVAFFQFRAGDYSRFEDVPEKLNLFGTPAIAVIDRSGEIQNFWVGYVDRELLARALTTANKAKPAKITPSEAPPAPNGFDATADAAATTSPTPLAGTTGA